jgi:chitin synthase
LNDKKFNEDRVKEQIRRRDIPLLLLDRTCEFSKTMTWKEFFARYSVIDPSSNSSAAKENGPKGGHKHSSSLASVTLSRTDADVLKAKVRKIYEMYGIITGGGNGKVTSSDDLVFMNERTYWALERNLVGIEMKQKKLKPEVEEDAVVPDFLDDDESGSAAQEEQDTEAKVLEKRRKQLQRLQLSSQRKWWLRITTFFTWWIPDIVIIKLFKKDRPDVVQAWREKVALCFIIFLLTALMLFMISGFGLILCPPAKIFSKDDLAKNFANQNARKNYMNIHGYVFDVAWIPEAMQTHDWKVLDDYAGKDASKFFPHGTVEECSVFGRIAKRQIRTPPVDGPDAPAPRSPSTTPESTTTEYSIPNDPKHVFENFKEVVEFGDSKIILAGKFAIAESDIAPRKDGASVQWVVINKNVYDVTRPIATNFFGDDVTWLLKIYAGSDMSSEANTLGSDVLGCLDKRFFIGVIDDRNNIQCTAAGYTLLSLTIILCSVMVAKFLAALQLGAKRAPEETERFVILQIPCYTEGEDSLRKTIRSCALLDYPDNKKLLFIIADGLIKGSGNDRMTPEIVLDILGVENSHEKLTSDVEVPRYDYIALGNSFFLTINFRRWNEPIEQG